MTLYVSTQELRIFTQDRDLKVVTKSLDPVLGEAGELTEAFSQTSEIIDQVAYDVNQEPRLPLSTVEVWIAPRNVVHFFLDLMGLGILWETCGVVRVTRVCRSEDALYARGPIAKCEPVHATKTKMLWVLRRPRINPATLPSLRRTLVDVHFMDRFGIFINTSCHMTVLYCVVV